MNILFYDVATPYTYTSKTVNETAIGGTEATITRIANGLTPYHTVYVAQHCRDEKTDCEENNVHYISLNTAQRIAKFDAVILLRDPKKLDETAARFPGAKLFFWMHNLPSKTLFNYQASLERYEIIAVSHFHRKLIEKRLHGKWYQRLLHAKKSTINVNMIYNPIAENLFPNETAKQVNKLLFLSSPQKGLVETLKMFEKVLTFFPDFQLLIGNPGHRHIDIKLPKQAEFLGPLPHYEVMQHLREAFCVFYPQHLRAETFGLVYAEANAVGTPVLAHNIGAAAEILSDPQQLIDGRNIKQIIAKLSAWKKQYPVLCGKHEFRLKNVISQWYDLLAKA